MEKKFIGWKQVVIISFIVGVTSNFFVASAAISNAIMKTSGQVAMSATVFGLGASVFSFMQGIPQLFIARVVTKKGSRSVLIVGCILCIAVGLGFSNLISTGASYVIIYGFFFGGAYVLTSQVASQTLVNNWFHARRGRAQGIMRAITTVFVVVAPYITNLVITKLGGGDFRIGWYLAGGISVLGLILCFFLVDNPEDVGQYPDGIPIGETIDVNEATKKVSNISTVYKRANKDKSITVKEAMKMPMFWFILICGALGFTVMMISSIANIHFLDKGISLTTVSLSSGARSMVVILFMMLMAAIADRIEPGFLAAGTFVLFALSCLFAAFPTGDISVYLYQFLAASINSTLFVLIPTMIGNYFGRESFPTIQGIVLMVGGLLSSTTGLISGYIGDVTGDFAVAFLIYGAISIIVAIICVFAIGIPSRIKYKKELANTVSN